jgi:hypothetical protein
MSCQRYTAEVEVDNFPETGGWPDVHISLHYIHHTDIQEIITS